MKLKYLAFPLLFAAALATGCQESAEYEPVVYMTDAQSVPSKSVTIDELPASAAVSVTASEKVSHDLEVTLELRPDLVESYNLKYGKNYLPLPEGSYEFLNDKVVISAGFTTSSMADFTVTSMDDFAEGATYCMPISIQSVNGSMGILEPSRTVYIVFKTPVISKAILIGSGNKYKIPGFLDNTDLVFPQATLETRVYVTSFSNGCDNSSIMGIEGECSVRFGDVKIDKNVVQICHENYQPAATDRPCDVNKWYHVAAVWTGSSWDIYIDGQFAAGAPTQGESMNFGKNDGYGFGLGALSQWQGSRPLNGYLAECRVWSRALSQTEIANNMNYVDPASEGLVAYWRMNEWEPNTNGSGNIVPDLTGHGYDAVGGSDNPTMMDTRWL